VHALGPAKAQDLQKGHLAPQALKEPDPSQRCLLSNSNESLISLTTASVSARILKIPYIKT